MQLVGSFLSHFIGDSLVVSSFTLSVTRAIAAIFPGTSTLSQIFSPKFQQGVNAFQIILSGISNYNSQSWELFWLSGDNFEKTALRALTMSHRLERGVGHADTE